METAFFLGPLRSGEGVVGSTASSALLLKWKHNWSASKGLRVAWCCPLFSMQWKKKVTVSHPSLCMQRKSVFQNIPGPSWRQEQGEAGQRLCVLGWEGQGERGKAAAPVKALGGGGGGLRLLGIGEEREAVSKHCSSLWIRSFNIRDSDNSIFNMTLSGGTLSFFEIDSM